MMVQIQALVGGINGLKIVDYQKFEVLEAEDFVPFDVEFPWALRSAILTYDGRKSILTMSGELVGQDEVIEFEEPQAVGKISTVRGDFAWVDLQGAVIITGVQNA